MQITRAQIIQVIGQKSVNQVSCQHILKKKQTKEKGDQFCGHHISTVLSFSLRKKNNMEKKMEFEEKSEQYDILNVVSFVLIK